MADSKKSDPTIGNPNPGGELNPDAPVASQDTEIRAAKHPGEKPDPSSIAQVEEIK